jgi:type IV pilus assembly protein PilE
MIDQDMDGDTTNLSPSSLSDLIIHDTTTVGAPIVHTDRVTGDRWVLFGTGRYFVAPDNYNDSAIGSQQFLYGVKQAAAGGILSTSSIFSSSIQDASGIEINPTTGAILTGAPTIASVTPGTFQELITLINDNKMGWKRELATPTLPAAAGRVTETGISVGNTAFFLENIPSDDVCAPEGTGRLNFVDFRSGTVGPFVEVDENTSPTVNFGYIPVASGGVGSGISAGTYRSVGGSAVTRIFTQSSSGELDSIEFTQGSGAAAVMASNANKILIVSAVRPSSNRGFTLIELMLVVGIVALIAAIAIPGYRSSVLKSNRSDARVAMQEAAVYQERHYAEKKAYTDIMTKLVTNPDRTGLSAVEGYSPKSHYIITADVPDSDSFTLTAEARGSQADDTECSQFTIGHLGKRLAEDDGGTASPNCW